MSRPRASVSVRIGRAWAALFGSVAFLAASFSVSPAQDLDDNETLIGTFELEPAGKQHPSKPPMGLAGPVPASQSAEHAGAPPAAAGGQGLSESQRFFADAMDELAAGRSSEAQRLLERVIAADGEGPLAPIARHHLAKLYRASDSQPASGGSEIDAPSPQRSGLADPAEIPEGAKATRAPAPRASGTRVSAEIEQMFILMAGDRVFFSSGSADLGGRARAVLAAQAHWLAERPDLGAIIEGHADDGSLTPEQHEALSEARAEAVRQRLVAEGVERERLSISPWGREHRISACEDAQCAAQNRRAVTVLIVRGSSSAPERLGAAAGGAYAARPNASRAR